MLSPKSHITLFLLLFLTYSSREANGQWVRAKGTERQVIETFAAKGSTLFAGAEHGPYPDTIYVGGAFRSTDNGASWAQINNGFFTGTVYPISVHSLLVSGEGIFAGTSNGVFVSTNDGANWTSVSSGIDSDRASRDVRALLITDSKLFAATGNGIFASSNNAASWYRSDSGIAALQKNVQCLIAVDSTIYSGGWDAGIFFSTNHGTSWNHSFASSNWEVTSLARIDSTIYAGTWYGSVFRSSDKGANWTRVDSGLTDTVNHHDFSVQSLAVSGKNLFAGTVFDGVFLSTNYGTNWSAVNSGLRASDPDDDDVSTLAVIGSYLFAGTLTSGAARRPLSEMLTTMQLSPGESPATFRLGQNYPNPFNPTTIIPINIPVKAFVSLKVYDLLGKEVASLVSGQLEAGRYQLKWYGFDFPTGVYFVRLFVRDYVETRKLILLK